MTKYEIVTDLANNNIIEKVVYKMMATSKNRFDSPKDLIQDLYVYLLEKDPTIIEDLYNKGELGFYILSMAKNQLFSVNSRYYYKYVKFRDKSEELESAKSLPSEDI